MCDGVFWQLGALGFVFVWFLVCCVNYLVVMATCKGCPGISATITSFILVGVHGRVAFWKSLCWILRDWVRILCEIR